MYFRGHPVKGILGTTLPPNKSQIVKKINDINVEDYDILVLPGGVKAMEKVRQNKDIIKFISNFNAMNKIIACICSGTTSNFSKSSKRKKDCWVL